MEIFKKIKIYDNYEISNLGNVRNIKTGKILKNNKNHCGYITTIIQHEKKAKTLTIHRLIAREFLSDFDEKLFVDHIDKNKLNNNISNLRMCNSSENSCNRNTNNKSGIKNIHYCNKTGKWRVKITKNNKVYLKEFLSKEDAITHRNIMIKELHGNFAN